MGGKGFNFFAVLLRYTKWHLELQLPLENNISEYLALCALSIHVFETAEQFRCPVTADHHAADYETFGHESTWCITVSRKWVIGRPLLMPVTTLQC